MLFQSTHSLRSATTIVSYSASGMLFQSTHSLRSATLSPTPYVLPLRFQSTHSLRSATSHQRQMVESQQGFNPRTPCGVRRSFPRNNKLKERFQSTHSLRSATALEDLEMINVWVSIHALLAECDRGTQLKERKTLCFNPRTPCGVRPRAGLTSQGKMSFQSTHSLRSATGAFNFWNNKTIVSIHALLAECDSLPG